jgi:hypothetical protein
LNLRDVLTYANFLGDDEYSGRVEKICDRLESLFSDKKNVERNCLFWYNPKGKENWREIHSYENLKRIGTMLAKQKALSMFNKYKLEELNNIDMEYIVPFMVNPDNTVSDMCINMYGPKDNDWYWYYHHYDKNFINKDKTIDEKTANEDFSKCFPHANTLTGTDIVRLVHQNKPISCL